MSEQVPQIGINGDGNVIGDGNIVVIQKQYFTGEYERLRDAYIEPWPVFERVNLDHFEGREWLLAEVDVFLRNHDRGYFILEAEAGLGKTTFLAWLVQERGYIHHFVELAPASEGVRVGLKNLAAQLVLACHLNPYEAEGILPGAAARPDCLFALLEQACKQCQGEHKTVLVIDALDEAGRPFNQNALGLPKVLPKGVFVIASQRPVPVALQVDTANTPRYTFRLAATDHRNEDDMRRFLENVATWPGIAQALRDSSHTPEKFAATLMEKCHGLWIYLHFVVHEIEQGRRSPLDLDTLPDGITQYYARHWQQWRDVDQGKWDQAYLPVLATLTAAQEGVSVERLTRWTGEQMQELELRRLLNERWRPFLAVAEKDNQTCYHLYHATLYDFFYGQVDQEKLTEGEKVFVKELVTETRKAHRRLARRYLQAWTDSAAARWASPGRKVQDPKGGHSLCDLAANLPGLHNAARRDIDNGYGLRHLAVHLHRAEETEALFALIDNRDWYEAKRNVDPTCGSFLGDIELAIEYAEALPGGEGLPRVIACSLLAATVRSWVALTPEEVLQALVSVGCIEQALRLVSGWPETQAQACRKIGDELEKQGNVDTAKVVLRRALSHAERISDHWVQAQELSMLAQSLAQVGLIDDGCHAARLAVAIGEKIEAPVVKALVLAEAACALSQVQVGLTNEARQIAQSALDCFARYRRGPLVTLVLMVKDALSEGISPIFDYTEALCKIARVFAQMGDFERAREVANVIGTDFLPARALVLGEISQQMWQMDSGDETDRRDEAREIAHQALLYARQILWVFRPIALIRLAEVLARMGEVEQCCSIAGRKRLALGHEDMHAKVAVALAESGHLDQAREFAHYAFDISRIGPGSRFWMWMMGDEEPRSKHAQVLGAIAHVLARAGEGREAERVAGQAIAVATELKSYYIRSKTFANLALALARGGLSDQATQAVQLALSVGYSVIPSIWRQYHFHLLVGLTQALARAGEVDGAGVIARHFELRHGRDVFVKNEVGVRQWVQAVALAGVAQAFAQAGNLKEALSVAYRIRGLRLQPQHVTALCLIGRAMARQGRVKEARRMLRRAQDIVCRPHVSHLFKRGRFWEDPALLAKAWIEAGETGRALRALAISDDWQASDYTWALGEIVLAIASVSSGDAQGLAEFCVDIHRGLDAGEDRWMALVGAAHAFAQLGDKDKASRLVDHALMAMESLESIPDQGVYRLGQTLTEIGDMERVFEVAESLVAIDKRDELLSGVVKVLAVTGNLKDAVGIALRVTNPVDRAYALALLTEHVCTSNSPDKFGYVRFAQDALRIARNENRKSIAHHIAALLPGLGIFGRDTVIAAGRCLRAAEHVVNLDVELYNAQLFGNACPHATSNTEPSMLALRESLGRPLRGLYLLIGTMLAWFSGCLGWIVPILIVDPLQRFRLDELSFPSDHPFLSMEGTAVLLALIGAMLYSLVVVRRYFDYRPLGDLLIALSGPLIPPVAFIGSAAYKRPTREELVSIWLTAPIIWLPVCWVLSGSVEDLAISFSLSFIVHLWLLWYAGALD